MAQALLAGNAEVLMNINKIKFALKGTAIAFAFSLILLTGMNVAAQDLSLIHI